ncbi:MAG: efflux RND transporter periplasmic adaptor subunit [Dokdonella sp.]
MMTILLRVLVTTCAIALSACAESDSDTREAARASASPSVIAAGGLVEPASEERVIIPQLSGRLARVLIEEGDSVTAGQLIAEIESAEYRAAVAVANALLAARTADLERLRNGARRQDIDQAVAVLAAARAGETLADASLRRNEPVFVRELISRAQIDEIRAAAEAARAERERSAAALALLRAGARIEDITAATAAVDAAAAERDRAQALYEKTQIRSPVNGIVLKRDLREGETVVALSPLPLARIGDLSKRFVRADIEELDIGRVRVEQRAHVLSDSFPGQKFEGRVVAISQRMGRRSQTSGNPSEKQDAKVLEVLLELDGQPQLPIGLRVDVFIDAQAQARK